MTTGFFVLGSLCLYTKRQWLPTKTAEFFGINPFNKSQFGTIKPSAF